MTTIPLADIRAGDVFLSEIFHAVASGPGWDKTVLIINYDEWGGFFEHVPPSRVTPGVPIGANPSTGIDQDLDANGKVLLGFRVPCIVASPFTGVGVNKSSVVHGLYDHTSVLKLIEWRWGLQPLSSRDASSASTDPGNLATILNFNSPDLRVPSHIPVLPPFTPAGCIAPASATAALSPAREPAVSPDASADRETWIGFQQSGRLAGWP